jgi:hypothetical protein
MPRSQGGVCAVRRSDRMRPSTRLPRSMRLKAEPRSAERQAKNRSFTWLSAGLRHSTRFAPAAMSICAASATARRAAGATGNSPSSVKVAKRRRAS